MRCRRSSSFQRERFVFEQFRQPLVRLFQAGKEEQRRRFVLGKRLNRDRGGGDQREGSLGAANEFGQVQMILITEQRQFVTGAVDQRARLMRLDQFAIPLAEAAELFEQFPAAEISGKGFRAADPRTATRANFENRPVSQYDLETQHMRPSGNVRSQDSRSCRSR